jgi:hypothetical protein
MYKPMFSWPRQQFEVSSQPHAPAALHPGKEPQYPLYRNLSRPQNLSGWHREIKILDSTDSNSGPQVIQPVASLNTDWATAHLDIIKVTLLKYLALGEARLDKLVPFRKVIVMCFQENGHWILYCAGWAGETNSFIKPTFWGQRVKNRKSTIELVQRSLEIS